MAPARLDPAGRRAIARAIAEDGLPPTEAAARFGVSVATARRWAARWERADPEQRRSGRWMDPEDEHSQDPAMALAEASIREAETLMASLGGGPVHRRPPRPAPGRSRRPSGRPSAARRLSARARAVRWTRRQTGGVGLTLAFIPLGWVGGAALIDLPPDEPRAVQSRPLAAQVFSPSAARGGLQRGSTLAAHARRRSVEVHRRPGSSRSTRLVARRLEGRRLPLVMLVERRRGRWLRVKLPVRPNGSSGWIRARDVRLRANPYRVRVLLTKKRLEVWRGKRLLGSPRIGVGQAVSPTPTGRYFITDLVKPPDPSGMYGPYAFGLSAFSPVYTDFRGGPGQIGIHGTDAPEALGSEVSAGCIRLGNRTITRLAALLPLGTPVSIRR